MPCASCSRLDTQNGVTAVTVAALRGEIQAVEALIMRGANLEAPNRVSQWLRVLHLGERLLPRALLCRCLAGPGKPP